MFTRVVASKSRQRVKIGCPTFLVYKQRQCYHEHILHARQTKDRKKQHHFHAILFFLAEANISYRKKMKRSRRDSNLHALCYKSCAFPVTLQWTGTATYIRHSVSNSKISSVYSAKTTDDRSEIKLAYATPYELQDQKKIRQYLPVKRVIFWSIFYF